MTANRELAARRGLSKSEIKDIDALHEVMNVLVEQYLYFSGCLTAGQKKVLRRTIRRLEYLMQDAWGFPRDKTRHTHWRRFPELYDVGTTSGQ